MSDIRVAIIGVGNCASALVQGVEYYRHTPGDRIPGLMHTVLGDYGIDDIKFTMGIDVNELKVGKDLSDAIFAHPNNVAKICDVRTIGAPVVRGMTHDSIGKYLQGVINISKEPTADIASLLNEMGTHVVVNFLPVGSEMATKWYIEQVLDAGCAFVNAIPVFIASSKYWQHRFYEAGVPVIGDDVKSQVGATIVHRVLTSLFAERGVRIDRTYQLNFGGNTDFLNMLERERLTSKKISKTEAVNSLMPEMLPDDDIHVGPSDYIPWLEDRKWCHIRIEGTTFGNLPLDLELKLEVHDSPNSAGVVIDAIRCAKIALDRGVAGALQIPSAYFMKSPPVQLRDSDAHDALEDWINYDRLVHRLPW